jgi:hypothetical protein
MVHEVCYYRHAEWREGTTASVQRRGNVRQKNPPHDRRQEVDNECSAGDRRLKARRHERPASGEHVGYGVQRLQGGTSHVAKSHEGSGRGGARDHTEADSVSQSILAHP